MILQCGERDEMTRERTFSYFVKLGLKKKSYVKHLTLT
jgi:hypothetical protein